MNKILAFTLFFGLQITVAQKNIFQERNFWKEQPSIETIDLKIKEGNNPTKLNRFGFDAVAWAILEKVDNKTIKHLLSIEGNGINKLTHDGRTYIFWAAYKDNIELVKHLIENGAKMDVIDDKGYSILNFSAVTGQQNPRLYDILLKNGASIAQKTPKGVNALLLIASSLKDLKFTQYFTGKGLKITDVDHDGNGIFNYAAVKENKNILNAIVNKGLPYKNLNKNGGNAMLFATKGSRNGYNSLEYFKYLDSLGVNPYVTTKNGKTPLHNLAYNCKDIASYEYFITKGNKVNSQNKDGNTALITASYSNDLNVINLLLKHTKNINLINKKGNSALTYAVEGNTAKTVELLLKKGANLNIIDNQGNNLMYYLLQSYSSKSEDVFNHKLELLGSNGLDMASAQENGNTLYHLALDKNSIPLLKLIKPFKQNINAQNKEGYTALQKAVMTAKNMDIIKHLISEGASKAVSTDFNESILDLAKENEAINHQNLNFLKL